MSRILLANGSPDVHGSEKYPSRKSMENSKRSGKGIFLYGTDSGGNGCLTVFGHKRNNKNRRNANVYGHQEVISD